MIRSSRQSSFEDWDDPPTPRIDERKLLKALRDTSGPLSPTDMHAICSLVLLCCHDRRVEREFLVDVLRVCDDMYMDAIRMDRAVTLQCAVRSLDKRNQLKPDDETWAQDPARLPRLLKTAFDDYLKEYTAKRMKLADMLALLTQCPSPEDTVS